METIPSAYDSGRKLVITPVDDGDAYRLHVSGLLLDAGPSPRVIVARADLLAALARVADVTIIDNRDLPAVDERGITPDGFGWGPEYGTHQQIAELARKKIRDFTAILRFHEAKIAEERRAAEREELDAIKEFLGQHALTIGTEPLARALHEKGFRP